MIFFKTRREVKQLRQDVAELRAMLVAHFGIKYTMQDFKDYYERHPEADVIPVREGEWYHYNEMLLPSGAVKFTDTPKSVHASFRDKRVVIDKEILDELQDALGHAPQQPDLPRIRRILEGML